MFYSTGLLFSHTVAYSCSKQNCDCFHVAHSRNKNNLCCAFPVSQNEENEQRLRPDLPLLWSEFPVNCTGPTPSSLAKKKSQIREV